MLASLAQIAPPLERIHGIRDRFVEGGKSGDMLFMMAIIAAVLLIAYLLASARRRRKLRHEDNPRQLFTKLLQRMSLTVKQRDMLYRVATDLHLAHPTILLLSPLLLRTHVKQWSQAKGMTESQIESNITETIRTLFGTPRQTREEHGSPK